MFERAVLHLDLDAFFVSVECLRNSALRGKPLIIGGSSTRGVVASCSYEARAYGVTSAMPIKMALRLCPDALVLKGDVEAYSKYSKLVTEVIAEDAPLFEKASIDEFYVDLTGMDRYIGCFKWSTELRQRVMQHSGLPISFGLSVNKLVSKVGTNEAKPNGAKMITAGTEKAFLAPLSTAKLPSIGKATYRKLSFMGVRTVSTLSQIPVALLQREFGKPGISLWKKANAIDTSPVVPYNEKKSISTENTFQVDTIEVRWLKDKLTKMVMKLAFELRQMPKLTSCITVKIRYADFNTHTKQRRIAYTANDKTLIRIAHELFDRLYERRQLVRLVGVRFSGLVHGSYQISLFEDSMKAVNLLHQMDRIRKRFGASAVMRASSLDSSPPSISEEPDTATPNMVFTPGTR
ncbi:MAG: DNA polymerase IV [Bacteroidota bacterium]